MRARPGLIKKWGIPGVGQYSEYTGVSIGGKSNAKIVWAAARRRGAAAELDTVSGDEDYAAWVAYLAAE